MKELSKILSSAKTIPGLLVLLYILYLFSWSATANYDLMQAARLGQQDFEVLNLAVYGIYLALANIVVILIVALAVWVRKDTPLRKERLFVDLVWLLAAGCALYILLNLLLARVYSPAMALLILLVGFVSLLPVWGVFKIFKKV